MRFFTLLLLLVTYIYVVSCQEAKQPKEELKASQLERSTIISDGHPLAVWSKTVKDSKGAVLLLHGRTWSARSLFDFQVEGENLSFMDEMNHSGYDAYALDLRGYGATPRDSTEWNTPGKAADDINATMQWISKKRNGEKIHLFGWSMGVTTTLQAAQRKPEFVATLILFGFAANPDSKAPEDLVVKMEKRRTTEENVLEDFVVPGSISKTALDAFVEVCLTNDSIRADWNQFHEFNEIDPEKLNVPVLLMQAEFDQYSKTEWQAKLFTRLKTRDKSWVVLPGGDHIMPLENTREHFYSEMLHFMDIH